jgi:hypothetical protein
MKAGRKVHEVGAGREGGSSKIGLEQAAEASLAEAHALVLKDAQAFKGALACLRVCMVLCQSGGSMTAERSQRLS